MTGGGQKQRRFHIGLFINNFKVKYSSMKRKFGLHLEKKLQRFRKMAELLLFLNAFQKYRFFFYNIFF